MRTWLDQDGALRILLLEQSCVLSFVPGPAHEGLGTGPRLGAFGTPTAGDLEVVADLLADRGRIDLATPTFASRVREAGVGAVSIVDLPDHQDYCYDADEVLAARGARFSAFRRHLRHAGAYPLEVREYREVEDDERSRLVAFLDRCDAVARRDHEEMIAAIASGPFSPVTTIVLRDEADVVGVAVRRDVPHDGWTLIPHFRTDPGIDGLGRRLFVEVARSASRDGRPNMNFEQDLGIAGLRRFKRSLGPRGTVRMVSLVTQARPGTLHHRPDPIVGVAVADKGVFRRRGRLPAPGCAPSATRDTWVPAGELAQYNQPLLKSLHHLDAVAWCGADDERLVTALAERHHPGTEAARAGAWIVEIESGEPYTAQTRLGDLLYAVAAAAPDHPLEVVATEELPWFVRRARIPGERTRLVGATNPLSRSLGAAAERFGVRNGASLDEREVRRLWGIYESRLSGLGAESLIVLEDTFEEFATMITSSAVDLVLSPATDAQGRPLPLAFMPLVYDPSLCPWLDHDRFPADGLYVPGLVAARDGAAAGIGITAQLGYATRWVRCGCDIYFECTPSTETFIPEFILRSIRSTGLEVDEESNRRSGEHLVALLADR
ncbi:MAG: phosphatidylglycerol lysyltransferase domain-containing protein [Microthrixaceae bacterium]